MLIDSHAHVSRNRYEPVESLLAVMDLNHVDRAVLVQSVLDPSPDYVLWAARTHPDRLAAVARVEVGSADLGRAVASLLERGAKGIRIDLRHLRSGMERIDWSVVAASDVPVSCVGPVDDAGTGVVESVLTEFPNLTIITEHLAGTNGPSHGVSRIGQLGRLRRLAAHANAHAKIHGLGELRRPGEGPCDDERHRSRIPDALAVALRDFGASRLMWGSDFPLVSSREGYRNALVVTRQSIDGLGTIDSPAIFGGNAARIYFA